ncbi:hypothetical protein EDD18DRAFT_1184090 [Armillaria luteobubalina]|uniref:Mid2 domain-containing protein n=1 Tax=Armillaria luteobubalina TaxID=153913 RepID=A0AA39PYG2_9AGAR|nr:hypothetical protein EDD18DRAFT_1184090 [Armillaria luteobubalina]
MIPVLLFQLLCSYILQVLSLVITVPTQPHPLVNANSSILLAWEEDDPLYFTIAVHRNLSSPGPNVTSVMQYVENFTTTRNIFLVFPLAGSTSIEAQTPRLTPANVNVTFAQSEPFQVYEDPTGDISTSSARGADLSSQVSSPTVSSTATSTSTVSASATSATPPEHEHYTAIIVGVVCGAFLLALITAIFLIRRCRKRRALPTNLENNRQDIIWPYLKRLNIPSLRDFFHDEREHTNHHFDVPPPPYSPLPTSEKFFSLAG